VTRWSGSGLAPGTAVAPARRTGGPPPDAAAVPVDPARVEEAFRAVAADLETIAARARSAGRKTAADIVEAGALIATDPMLIEAARRAAAAPDPLAAITRAVDEHARVLESLPDETLRERAADVRQVGRRVLDRLARPGPEGGDGRGRREPAGAAAEGAGFVLLAEELGPADLLEHLGQGLVAAVTVRGGANSHAAIVARSAGLPLVAGVAPDLLDVPDDTPVLVDADAGLVVADPPEDEIARAGRAAARERDRRAALAAERGLPHRTADGRAFTVACNVATDVEAHAGRVSGAAGIGLLRTELPFLEFERWPAEADHRRALRPILAEASGWPVTLRLLDFANDKIPPFLRGTAAGLDALLRRTDALEAQIRAAVQVRGEAELRVMVPMVTRPGQVRTVRAVVEAVVARLREDGLAPPAAVPVGAMIETVEAVAEIAALCEVCDFVSIGTNDLTAQVLGLDRRDGRARPELAAHPRVLEPVGRVVAAAGEAGVPVSVCGDSGAHPVTLPLLLGAGVRDFSVACARVDEVRYRLRRLRAADCAGLYAEALTLADAEQVAGLVRRRAEVPLP